MKKILVLLSALMALTTYASATYHCQTPECPTCVDGKDGANGTNGTNGLSAYEIAQLNGFEGTSTEWLESLQGADGEDGVGVAGADGNDGKDTTNYNEFIALMKKQNDYATDSAAGGIATDAIDFGSVHEGELVGGLGLGYASSYFGDSTVGGAGAKYGITDDTAGVVKTWVADSDSYAVGVALVHKF